MAHFARIQNNIVQEVIVVKNDVIVDGNGSEQESVGIDFCRSLYGADGEWVQTSYNGSFRKNFAGVGFTYDSTRDAFIEPQPFASWTLNETTCKWDAPVTMPDDGSSYQWDEANTSWVQMPEDE